MFTSDSIDPVLSDDYTEKLLSIYQEIELENIVVIAMPKVEGSKDVKDLVDPGETDLPFIVEDELSSDDTLSFRSTDFEWRIPLIPRYTSLAYPEEEYNLNGQNFEEESPRLNAQTFQPQLEPKIGSRQSAMPKEEYNLKDQKFDEAADACLNGQPIQTRQSMVDSYIGLDEDYNLDGKNFEVEDFVNRQASQIPQLAVHQPTVDPESKGTGTSESLPLRVASTFSPYSNKVVNAAIHITDENVPERFGKLYPALKQNYRYKTKTVK